MSGEGSLVPIPRVDLVISNPPYTRRGSDGGKEEAIARVFQLPEGDEDSEKAIRDHTSALLRGTPANQTAGHGSSFTVLADRLVKRGGRVALVLPVTALSGESWRGIRETLASRYEVEFVVSSHDPDTRSMSYDTQIAETLIVARRLNEGESPSRRGRFVNLWRAARRETDALALVSAVNAAASLPSLRSDGPPVGGSALMVGGEQWGELVDGPVGESAWKSARWRYALIGQFAAALERGELWTADGMIDLRGRFQLRRWGMCATWGHRSADSWLRLEYSIGYHGVNEQAQFPCTVGVTRSSNDSPEYWFQNRTLGLFQNLTATIRRYGTIWHASHITRDVQYDSQSELWLLEPVLGH